MRIHVGAIPEEFSPDSSWRPMREPGPMVAQFLALPLGVLLMMLTGYFWVGRMQVRVPILTPHEILIYAVGVMLAFPVLIALHEFIHATFHPRSQGGSDTIVGVWPRRLLFYAHYMGPLSRERFATILIAPLLIISGVPVIVEWLTPIPGPFPFLFAFASSVINATCSCGDVLGVALLLWQVPRGATVRNRGWRTYWKSGASEPVD